MQIAVKRTGRAVVDDFDGNEDLIRGMILGHKRPPALVKHLPDDFFYNSLAKRIRMTPLLDDASLIVNGASGGQTAETWDSPNDPNYTRVRDQNLARAGVTEKQVQVAWLKVANPRPTTSLPAENADAYQLIRQMGDIARAMKVRYPNLGLVYVSSRIYAGYATTTLNPEPYAYESGLSVKLLVEAQIDQMRRGNVDPRAGNLDYRSGVAPWLAWGPYLWANDGIPRAGDGLTWQLSDLAADGTHPSQSGQEKVGALLLQFFKNEVTTRPWFLKERQERRRGVRRGAG